MDMEVLIVANHIVIKELNALNSEGQFPLEQMCSMMNLKASHALESASIVKMSCWLASSHSVLGHFEKGC